MKEFIEKLIGRLEEYKTKYYVTGITNNPYEFGACNAMDSAIKIVNELAEEYINTSTNKSTNISSGWIPCKVRLPEKYCHCLVTRRNDYEDGFDTDVCEDCFLELEGFWGWQSKFEGLIDNIIAWMPLPQPYTEEQKELSTTWQQQTMNRFERVE